MIVFRGREIVHPETGQAMLDRVVKAVADIAMVEQRPMMEGRRMVMIIGPRVGVIRPLRGAPVAASARRAEPGGPSGTSPPAPAAAEQRARRQRPRRAERRAAPRAPAPAAAKPAAAAAPSPPCPQPPSAAKRSGERRDASRQEGLAARLSACSA